ncbi:MAG: hypothetical protein QGG63_02435 [Candidatus Pacebacteria bacterium]|nr:hypothetical protein [Candidatus Paceibacterota bacterium]
MATESNKKSSIKTNEISMRDFFTVLSLLKKFEVQSSQNKLGQANKKEGKSQ